MNDFDFNVDCIDPLLRVFVVHFWSLLTTIVIIVVVVELITKEVHFEVHSGVVILTFHIHNSCMHLPTHCVFLWDGAGVVMVVKTGKVKSWLGARTGVKFIDDQDWLNFSLKGVDWKDRFSLMPLERSMMHNWSPIILSFDRTCNNCNMPTMSF